VIWLGNGPTPSPAEGRANISFLGEMFAGRRTVFVSVRFFARRAADTVCDPRDDDRVVADLMSDYPPAKAMTKSRGSDAKRRRHPLKADVSSDGVKPLGLSKRRRWTRNGDMGNIVRLACSDELRLQLAAIRHGGFVTF
jgi:hypothetical protein